MGQAPLLFVALLATSIWVGGFVAIALVARVVRRQLDARSQIAFFRDLGRTYGRVGVVALAVAFASGALLMRERDWDATATAAVVASAALIVVTGAGVVQARWMTRARERAIATDRDDATFAQVHRGARVAGALRAAIGGLTLVLLALVAALAT